MCIADFQLRLASSWQLLEHTDGHFVVRGRHGEHFFIGKPDKVYFLVLEYLQQLSGQ